MRGRRAFAGPAAGGLGSQGIYAGGYTYPGNAITGITELWNATATTTGSFGLLKPRGGTINTEAFQVTSSLFRPQGTIFKYCFKLLLILIEQP
mgnify:CR=1 FL=1